MPANVNIHAHAFSQWHELSLNALKEMQLHKKAMKHEINSVICLQATGQRIYIVGLPFQVLFLWIFSAMP